MVSFDSTMRSNISVGLPIDLLVYETDAAHRLQRRIDEVDPYFQMVHHQWGEGLRRVFAQLPNPDWIDLDGHPRCPPAPHDVSLRSARCAVAARDPAAARAALPHADPRLFAATSRPPQHFLNWQQDPYGNWVARLVFPEPADQLDISVDLTADMTVINPFDFFVEPYAEIRAVRLCAGPGEGADSVPRNRAAGPAACGVARALPADDPARRATVDMLVRLNQHCSTRSAIWCGWSRACSRPTRRSSARSGSCRDTGWLLVQILRHLGIAARFASGYLIQLTADVKPLDGPAGPDRDFTDLHAWAEVYLPGAGWIGLDPTSGLLAGEGHIPLACTADPGSAAPVIGYTDVCEVDFTFAMQRHAHARGSARHQAVHRRAVGGDSTSSASTSMRISSRTTCG